MNLATTDVRHLAERILAFEKAIIAPNDQPSSAFFIFEKISPHFITMMGSYGYQQLLERALVLASKEFPWLSKANINNDGLLDEMSEIDLNITPEDFSAGKLALLTHLLRLLNDIIGEGMTLRLLRDVWPELADKTMSINQGKTP
ncbi:MAG: hypothetical protein ORN51_11380 [Akkermansiaceae bacterium]|nr:hypothetical protein [Akkermansiaceae bacterium]